MRKRLLLGLLTIAVLALAVPATSLAASTPKKLPTAKTTVKDKNGKPHHVTVRVTHVDVMDHPTVAGDQNLVADGYRISAPHSPRKSREVTPEEVNGNPALAIPISQGSRGKDGGVQTQQLVPPAPEGSCQILFLNLAPIHLDLLGLVVDTSQIQVRILGVPGEGNLLGNLLCAVTGILDPDPPAPGGPLADLLDQLVDIINQILGILGGIGG
jgi:hypothetical protein